MSLIINEIYHSIQGESTLAGQPCIFIRLTYCNLRCSYCDTEHAFYNGKEMRIKIGSADGGSNKISHKISLDRL